MPKIVSFSLKNFKGASDVQVDIGGKPEVPVITLIGLNESGKTTILEGVSHFVTGDKDVSGVFGDMRPTEEVINLIPVHKKAAFSDTILCSATIELDDVDIIAIAHKLKKDFNLEVEKETFPRKFTIDRSYRFKDSAPERTNNLWGLSFSCRKRKGSKFRPYTGPKEDEDNDPWLAVVDFIEDMLPTISYFPTFLVQMPPRIYLDEVRNEEPINRYYRIVLQDVLDSLAEGISLQKHVVDRLQQQKQAFGTAGWFTQFFGTPAKTHVDSVFQKLSNSISREIIGSWNKIFQRPTSAKSIFLEWSIDAEKNDRPYASFYVSDGESRYALHERSLGFRWFFSFLLFTSFKNKFDKPVIFLFDEPAANLHAKAQTELLKSFDKILSSGNRIIYSTHSHHMIEPKWLSGAYIVDNKAIDYDEAEGVQDIGGRPTDISVKKYRHFVGQHPNRVSYYQPVLEKLDYITPSIVGAPPHLIVEGISDFYALRYAADRAGITLSVTPGGGAGSSGPVISLLMGQGAQFLLLLDDDAEGRRQATRYREGWLLDDSWVCTLADLDPKLKGAEIESLLSQQTKDNISAAFERKGEPTKKQIALAFSEVLAGGPNAPEIDEDTFDELTQLLRQAKARISGRDP